MTTSEKRVGRSSQGQVNDAHAERFPLSVIVLTYNESDNIAACLESVSWVDDVIVVDSGSVDGTIGIARKIRPDVRAFEHPFRDFGDQRNWALAETGPKHEWVFFLDADERCTAGCAEAVRAAVESPGDAIGFYLTYRNFFLDRWIKYSTLYPSWQLRLLKRGAVRFQKEGHGQREVTDGPLGYIHEPYDHYGFSKGIAHWVERHNRYSSEEMSLIKRLREEPLRITDVLQGGAVVRRRCLKRLRARFGCRPLLRFLYTYVLRGGFMDGRAGLVYCLLRVAHDIHVDAKLVEAEAGEQRNRSRSTAK